MPYRWHNGRQPAESTRHNLVFNAFKTSSVHFFDETWEDIKDHMDLNVGVAFEILKRLLPVYIKKNRGSLLFTGGGFGVYPSPDYLSLGVSKAGLRNLVLAGAECAKGTNVQVAVINIQGHIDEHDEKYSPAAIANEYWKLYAREASQPAIDMMY